MGGLLYVYENTNIKQNNFILYLEIETERAYTVQVEQRITFSEETMMKKEKKVSNSKT